MYDNGDSDLVTSDLPPIDIYEDGLFIRPCWAQYGYKGDADVNNAFNIFAWINFFELPAGWNRTRFNQAISTSEARFSTTSSSGFATKTYYFQDQPIHSVFRPVQGFMRDDFLFIDRIGSYQGWVSSQPGESIQPWDILTGNFSPNNNGSFILYIYDDTGGLVYQSNPNKGAYVYDVSCGDCDNLTQLKVGDDSSTGYRCLPYENLIEWAKQQRQKLKKI
ncbi:MAG TPA: hypothetical protein V6C95_23470 [Coleofasciculaceae cyanobacterium]